MVVQVFKAKIHPFRKFLIYQTLSFTARFRPIWLLKIVRVFYNLSDFNFLIYLYDPNVIRKRIKYRFKEKIVVVKLKDGGELLVDINDHIGWRIFMNGYWDNLILNISRILGLKENDTILDIGANIGAVSIPVASQLGVEIIAVEPSKLNATLFRKNVDLNSVKSTLHQVAVVSPTIASSNEFVMLYDNNGNHGSNSLIKDWNSSVVAKKEQYVPTATLDSLLSHAQLDQIKLIKIDIEGSENQALLGFNSLKRICAPIIFEYRIDIGSREIKKTTKEFALNLSLSFDLYGIKINEEKIEFMAFKFEYACENAVAFPPTISSKLRSTHPNLFKP